jgi:hypothetical protein
VSETVNRLWAEQARLGTELHDATYKVAEKMLQMGYNEKTVAEQTGLAVAAIKDLKKELDDKTMDVDGFTKKQIAAIEKIRDGLVGEAISYRENVRAIKEAIDAGNEDIDAKERIVGAIEKLKKSHQQLTPEMLDYLKANRELTPEYQKQKTALDAIISSIDGDSKSVRNQIEALDAWIKTGNTDEEAKKRAIELITKLEEKGITLTDSIYKWDDANKENLESTDSVTSGLLKYFVAATNVVPVNQGLLDSYDNLDSSANEFHDGMTQTGETISTVAIPLFTTLGKNVVPQLTNALRDAAKESQGFGQSFSAVMSKDLPRVLQRAFEGGGGLEGAVRSLSTDLGRKMGGNLVGSSADGTGLMGKLFSGGDGTSMAEGLVSGFASAGITTAISIGASLLMKGLTALFRDHTADDIARDAGTRFGTTFSKATADAILKDKNAGMTEMAAELNNLSAIIKDAGGLTDKTLPTMTARLHDVFSMIETHQMTIAQGTKVIDENWQAFAEAGTEADGRLADSLKEIIKLNDTFGTQSKAITDYLKGQGMNAIAGFSGVVAGVLTPDKLAVWDDLHKKLADADAVVIKMGGSMGDYSHVSASAAKAQKDAWDNVQAAGKLASSGLADLGTQAVATFAAAVASGTSEVEALKAIHPALSTLQQAYTDLGLDTDDAALKALMMRDKIATAAPEMVNGIASLSQEMIALDNMGLLNVKTFEAMERSGQTMYDELQGKVKEMGGTDADVLSAMQDYLHEAQKEAEKLGHPLDDNTQKLIDQSKEAGIWQDALTPQDKLLKGIQTLVDKVTDLVNKLSGIPSKIDTTITTHYQSDGQPPQGAGTEPFPSFDNRPMERVTSAGLALLHPGDYVGVPKQGMFGGGDAAGHLAYVAEGIDTLNNTMAALPDTFGRKVRDAIQMAGM